jgi:hypothetical protein
MNVRGHTWTKALEVTVTIKNVKLGDDSDKLLAISFAKFPGIFQVLSEIKSVPKYRTISHCSPRFRCPGACACSRLQVEIEPYLESSTNMVGKSVPCPRLM